MTYRERQRLADIQAAIDAIRSHLGALAARAAISDIADACVVEGALRRRDLVVSADAVDLQSIAAATGSRLEIDHP